MNKCVFLLVGMFCIISLFIIPVTAFSPHSSTIAEKEIREFTVSPFIWDGFTSRSSHPGNVAQGETKTFSVNVPYGTTTIDTVVSWTLNANNNNLGLEIIPPNSQILGEYDDFYESSVRNGKIPVKINAKSGYTLQGGQWDFKIRGKSVVNSQAFTLTINCA